MRPFVQRFPLLVAALVAGLVAAGCARTPDAPDSRAFETACIAERGVPRAPDAIRSQSNPLPITPETIAAGRRLYQETAHPIACAQCHGEDGDGQGPLARHLDPAPADFTCRFFQRVPDGQLFWITREGSGFVQPEPGHTRAEVRRPGRRDRTTAMRPHGGILSETEIWQIVAYLRTFHSAGE
ncbi:MAG: cytochrome c [Wenzhouxiangellaceae bacterium]|nr:cytochrome c [Wenzhouxiangellaceae bacterium]